MEINLQQSLKEANVKSLFADEIFIADMVKAIEDDKGRIKKEGIIKLVCMDVLAQKPVVSIAITNLTANGLYLALKKALEKQNADLKSKKLPEKPMVTTTKPKDYMG